MREYFRALVILIITLMSGVVVNVYQIIVHKAPLYSLALSSFGFIIVIRLLLALFALVQKMQRLEEEIECL